MCKAVWPLRVLAETDTPARDSYVYSLGTSNRDRTQRASRSKSKWLRESSDPPFLRRIWLVPVWPFCAAKWRAFMSSMAVAPLFAFAAIRASTASSCKLRADHGGLCFARVGRYKVRRLHGNRHKITHLTCPSCNVKGCSGVSVASINLVPTGQQQSNAFNIARPASEGTIQQEGRKRASSWTCSRTKWLKS